MSYKFPYPNYEFVRIYNFEKLHPPRISQTKSQTKSITRYTKEAIEMIEQSSNIQVSIVNPTINETYLDCYLDYTNNSDNILEVYKNDVLITDYIFDNNTRIIKIPLCYVIYDSSTYSICETDIIENVSIIISTEMPVVRPTNPTQKQPTGGCNIKYLYNIASEN